MGINIKELIKKESKYASKASKLIKQKESLYSKLDNTGTVDEKAKIEENISKLDNQFSNVMTALNNTRIKIDKEMVSRVSKPREDKTKYRSVKKRGTQNKVFKRRSRDYSDQSQDNTRYGKTHVYGSSDAKADKVKTSGGVYAARSREEFRFNTEEQTNILSEILKVLRGDSKEEKKDRKDRKKQSKISRFAKKMAPQISAFNGIMDKLVVGLGSLAFLPQLKDMFYGGATGANDDVKTSGKTSKGILSKIVPDYLTYEGHMKFAEKHQKTKAFEKSSRLSKLGDVKTKSDEDIYLSKQLAQSEDWKRTKGVIKKYKSYATAGFDIKSKRSPHKEDSSHYKGIKVDLGTRPITSKWGGTEAEQNAVKKELVKFIYELGLRGATKIIFEYDDNTPKDLIKVLKDEAIPLLKKKGVNFLVEKTAGTGEHLDVMYDKKYALKQEDIAQITKSDAVESMKEVSMGGIFDTIGVDFNKAKKTMSDRFKTIKNRLASGESIRESMMDFKLKPRQKPLSDAESNTMTMSEQVEQEAKKNKYYQMLSGGTLGKNGGIIKDIPKLRKPDAIQELKDEESQIREEIKTKEMKKQGQTSPVIISSNDNNSTTINNSGNGGDKFGYIYDEESNLFF